MFKRIEFFLVSCNLAVRFSPPFPGVHLPLCYSGLSPSSSSFLSPIPPPLFPDSRHSTFFRFVSWVPVCLSFDSGIVTGAATSVVGPKCYCCFFYFIFFFYLVEESRVDSLRKYFYQRMRVLARVVSRRDIIKREKHVVNSGSMDSSNESDNRGKVIEERTRINLQTIAMRNRAYPRFRRNRENFLIAVLVLRVHYYAFTSVGSTVAFQSIYINVQGDSEC